MSINNAEIKTILHRHLECATGSGVQIIHTRSRGRGGLIRLNIATGGTVIVKVWHTRTLKELFKSVAYLSNGRREWRMHRLIYQAGIDVPEPLAFYRLLMADGSWCEAMVLEDLGETENGMTHLKQLISAGDQSAVLAFENDLIVSTARLLDLHILDIDHRINNFVVDARGRLIRIDFECARRYPFHVMPQQEYVKMLARFITGFIHAVQPDVGRSVDFTARLYEKLGVNRRIKAMIKSTVNDNLIGQLERTGIDTKVMLPV